MKDSEIVSRLRGFIDINGDEPPDEDQWYKIVKLVFTTEDSPAKGVTSGISPEFEDLLRKHKESGPYGPLDWPPKPFGGGVDLNPLDPYKIVYSSGPEGSTALCEGFTLNNDLGDIDLDGLELTVEMESKPNILETDSVEFSFEPGDPPSDVRDTRPDG